MKKKLLFLLFLTIPISILPQEFSELLKIDSTSDYSEGGDEFGNSIAISGNYAVIGNPDYNPTGIIGDEIGAIHIYSLNSLGNWTLEQTIERPPSITVGKFGEVVAIDGTTIVVGVKDIYLTDLLRSGSAYIYNRENNGLWTESQIIVPFDEGNAFADAISIDGNHIIVGANIQLTNNHGGQVYIYEKNASGIWVDSQILFPDNYDLQYGITLDISGNYFAVAARDRGDDGFQYFGKVYLYEKNTSGLWLEKQSLQTFNNLDGFGSSLSMSGATLAVGASNDSNVSGAVYVYERNSNGNWLEVQKLVPSNPPPPSLDDYGFEVPAKFGYKVEIEGNKILVGTTFLNNVDGAYTFSKQPNSSWLETDFIKPLSDTSKIRGFGYRMAFNGEHAFISGFDYGGEAYISDPELQITSFKSRGVVYAFGPSRVCDEVAIPDPVFEQYLITDGIDTDGEINGKICRQDAEAATFILMSNATGAGADGVDFTGIEAFINLELFLYTGIDGDAINPVKLPANNLDFSNMPNLNEIKIDFTLLETLDLSNNVNLVELSLENNAINTLDLTQNSSLEILKLSQNNLSSLDLTQNLSLIEAYCDTNQITDLQVGTLPNLEILECQENLLPNLNVSGNPSLRHLNAGDNLLTTGNLIVDNLPQIETIDIDRNNVDAFDLTIYPTLEGFYARENGLSTLDFSLNPALTAVDIAYNQFERIDLSANPLLNYLLVYNNSLSFLNIRNGALESSVWAFDNPNLTCIQVDNTTVPTRNFLNYGHNLDNPSEVGPSWSIDVQTSLDEQCSPSIAAEIGNASGNHNFSTLSMNHTFNDPIVFVGALSKSGGDPGNIRVNNVNSDSFQWRVDEWEYVSNQNHVTEQVSYMVVEKGSYDMDNGFHLESGSASLGTSYTTVNFSETGGPGFANAPIVLVQVVTENESQSVRVRLRNVTESSFEMALQEEENGGTLDGSRVHIAETVHWIAMENNVTDSSGDIGTFEIRKTDKIINHKVKTLNFSQNYSSDQRVFLAHFQTTFGGDAGSLRRTFLNESSVGVFYQEEKSKDAEINHVTEELGYAIFDGQGLLQGAPSLAVSLPLKATLSEVNGSNESLSSDNKIFLYPNPSKDILNIAGLSEETTIQITDVLGRILIIEKVNPKESRIDLSNLSNGLYFLELDNKKNSERLKFFKD